MSLRDVRHVPGRRSGKSLFAEMLNKQGGIDSLRENGEKWQALMSELELRDWLEIMNSTTDLEK